ncbi:alpha/beta fold hydrolase [Pseudonocardia sp. MH-G8]|uniref:alpha/beta fold hydrolase n=1 Tax=Pseudonocardia sp. MH-G8 TaxID=1854588 RepID=UPI000BA11BC4|nr:alpha/beta hydrolase [Pseudonocardia sp. MH-G8]OZM78516.1 alpha/beta hydrolase [Pseudonocardia sp. MH-G8]
MPVAVADPLRSGTTPLPDGRLLGWAEWGPVDGAPVLFAPGAATSSHLGFGADVVDDLRIRLIALDRPGLGTSTPAPQRTFTDFAADVAAFAARRDLGRPAMVGNSQGAPFALACAAAGAIEALALASAADEVAAPGFADALPAHLRSLVDLAGSAPSEAEGVFRGFTPERMWDMVEGAGAACDLEVYRQPGFAAAYRRALAQGFAQGADGYARDTLLAMSRWQIALSTITAPVDLWYGEHDHSHSPDQGVTLAERIPTATRHLVRGVGGAVLWTHAEQILWTLGERVGGEPRPQRLIM